MKSALLAALASLLLAGAAGHAAAQSVDFNQVNVTNPVAVIETGMGSIVIEFFPGDAPGHVENFLKLASSGFYDGTLFHRIIPGFMIQGGDPNTVSGDPSTWGQGGPVDADGARQGVDAEFNTIKHSRGIVSMARAADPDSAGSQFFIVHQDSDFLDEQYTVFGRIVTDESFETLDRIAGVTTGPGDVPDDPEPVRITSVTLQGKADVPGILDLPPPERTTGGAPAVPDPQPPADTPPDPLYRSEEHNVSVRMPDGWLVQTPPKNQDGAPDVVAVGPLAGGTNPPVISLTIEETDGRSLDELIAEKEETLAGEIEAGNLEILSSEKKKVAGLDAYEINADGVFVTAGGEIGVKFRDILVYTPEKSYNLSYSNGPDDFDSQLPLFEETVGSFSLLSGGGGCLVATAAFGSELAPQVQRLREIRDNTLLDTGSGAAFMAGFNSIYYAFSPAVADMERQSPAFRELVRASITPMMATLSLMENAESEAGVLGYGTAVILLNLAMYLGAPAAVLYGLKRAPWDATRRRLPRGARGTPSRRPSLQA